MLSCQAQQAMSSAILIDPSLHQLFYSAVQGALYVFCYAHAKLVAANKARGIEPHNLMSSLGFSAVVSCPLAPLRICNRAVVSEFEALWNRYAGDILGPLVQPQRSTSPQFVVRSPAPASGQAYTLDAFFPFDPYILRSSARHIDPLYTTWASSQQEKAGDDEDDARVPRTSRKVKTEKVKAKMEEESDEDTSTETDIDEPPDGAVMIQRNRSPSMGSSASSSMGSFTPMSFSAVSVLRSRPQLVPQSTDVTMAGSTPGVPAVGNFNFTFD
jgi:RNA polymerase I-specific transcription initiation factor RRN3